MVAEDYLSIINDPNRVVTDPVVLSALAEQEEDWRYWEFWHDYQGTVDKRKSVGPWTKSYRSTLNTDRRLAVVSQLVKMLPNGNRVIPGWQRLGGAWVSHDDYMQFSVRGRQVTAEVKYPVNGLQAGQVLRFTSRFFYGGQEVSPIREEASVISDPFGGLVGPVCLEWDFGNIKRWLRLVNGKLIGLWVSQKPIQKSCRFQYDQKGDFKLRLDEQFYLNDDTEYIPYIPDCSIVTNRNYWPIVFPGLTPLVNDTLIFNPGSSYDDTLYSFDKPGSHTMTWLGLRSGDAGYSKGGIYLTWYCKSDTSTPYWYELDRAYIHFDPTSIADDSIINSATAAFYGVSKLDDCGLATSYSFDVSLCYYLNTITTGISGNDWPYQKIGVTLNQVTYASMALGVYNSYVLPAGTICPVHIFHCILVDEHWDKMGTAPPWPGASLESYMRFYSSDNGTNEPKLTVTYTPAVGGGGRRPRARYHNV
mgnify:CR=1 FL=1